MRLSSLEPLDAFALLGPGFGDGRSVLVTGLRETRSSPLILFAPYETEGREARGFTGELREVTVEPDVVAPHLRIDLAELMDPGYVEAVQRIRAAIEDGDVYQVCHTLQVPLESASGAPLGGAELMARFCRHEVPRFAAWVRLGRDEELVSASPECFFEIDRGRIRSEPMKGTARPGAAGQLTMSEKDQAELAMITDLVRNDLAQVCRPRSVQVTCPRRIVELPYALQAVSDVTGTLETGWSLRQVLQSLHPGGSVTGTPKRAALAMIRTLESGPRRAYCGALGLCRGERAVFSLLIRTARRGPHGWLYGVGSGIVYDSDPEQEREELQIKLGAL